MGEEVAFATTKLRDFMFERVYTQKALKDEEQRADKMISALYEYYKTDCDRMPDFYKDMLENNSVDTVVCDYISGMSDAYAEKTFSEIFIPRTWKQYRKYERL